MNEDDLVRLRHMLDAAREVVAFTQSRTPDDLNSDRLFLRGLSMSIGIIGEAASRISREFQDTHPQIPWPFITGMRNRVFHGYYDLRHERLWETAIRSVPELIVELEKLIPPENEG